MATLTDFRQPGGVKGDNLFNAEGEWTILDVKDDGSVTGIGDYYWGLVDPSASVITPPDTTGTLSARVNTIETALGNDILTLNVDLVTFFENKLC